VRLTRDEREMLDGKYGDAIQKAMEILFALGECYGAERMMRVSSAHIAPCNPSAAGKGGTLFFNDMADRGGKLIVPTTTNPACLDPWGWRRMGFSEELYREQVALSKVLARMDGLICNTCTPYLIGHVPRLGEHVAWGESSAVVYVNAILGGRTNREGAPSALASGLTGRTPAYGYHLDENRHGELKVLVNADLKGFTDYASLGYFAGKIAQDRVPIFSGISSSVSQDELIWLGAGLASSGSVAHFHAVGITPEAPTEEKASGFRKIGPSDTFEFGSTHLKEIEASLSKVAPEDADLVILGCPHVSIAQIKHYAKVLSGRRVKERVEVWILASHLVKKYAEDIGYSKVIESAGVRIVSNTCPSAIPSDFFRSRNYRAFATDSPKLAYLLSGSKNLLCYFGRLETFIDTISTKKV
jgi:predicted aconitase